MARKILIIAIAATASMFAAEYSMAGVVLTLDDATATAGGSVLLGVYAHSTSTDTVSGYNLPLDVSPAGNVLFPGLTLGSPVVNNAFAGFGIAPNFTTTFNAALDIDGRFDLAGGSNVLLTSTPIKLFDIKFELANTIPIGTIIPVRIVPTSPVDQLKFAGPPGTTISSIQNGSITIDSVAVPESSGLARLALATFLAVSCLSAKRRAGVIGSGNAMSG